MTKCQPVVARAEDGLHANGYGNVESIAHGDAIEAWARDAGNLERIAVESEAFADDGGIPGVIALPERVADICRRGAAARLVIFRIDEATENGLNAKGMKEIASNAKSFGEADFAPVCQVEFLASPGGDFRESFLALADLFPHREAELGVLTGKLAGTPVAIGDSNGAQLLGILDWSGAQADGINELEDGGVGANADGEGKDGNDGEAGTKAKKSESVTKVLPE